MKRDQLVSLIRFAGAHEDTATGTRLLIENRISREAYSKAFNEGRAMKASGMRCDCSACKKG